jgi:hypothetical protein
MQDQTPKPRRSWFDSIPWWLWVAIAVTHAPLIYFQIDDLMTAATERDRTEAILTAVLASVWSLFAVAMAMRAWQQR